MTQLCKKCLEGEIIEPHEGVWVIGRPRPFEGRGHKVKLPAGLTVTELLDGAIGDRRSHIADYIAYIDGQPVPRHMHDRIRVKAGHTVSYAPRLTGGSMGRSIATIGLSILAIAASIFLPPLIGPFAAALIGAGLVVGGGLLINALFPVAPQSLEDQQKGFKTAYSISGSSNTADPFGPVPLIFGRMRVWPRYGARPYVKYSNDKQYLVMLFCIGYGTCDVSDIRIGETPIIDYNGLDIEVYEAFESATDNLQIYRKQTFQEQFNIELTEEAGWQHRVTAMAVDDIDVLISLPRGWYVQDPDDGSLQGRHIHIRAEYRIFNSGDDWHTLDDFEDNNYKKKKPKILHLGKDGLDPEQYEVRVKKATNDDDDANVVEDMFWIALTGKRLADPISFAKPLTIIECNIKATEQLNGVIDSLNCMVDAQVIDYVSGVWTPGQHSRNPAAAFLWALQGPGIAEPVPDDEIDFDSLAAWHAYCDDNEFEFNYEHSKRTSVFDTLRMIAASGKARVLRTDGLWGVIWDEEEVPVAQHFTPRNSWGFSEQRVYFEAPHALRISFINEDNGYVADELRVYSDGYNSTNATKFESVEFPGVTNETQAAILADFQLQQALARPSTYTLTTNWQSLTCTVGDKIYCTHDAILIGKGQGRIIAATGSAVTLDELVLFETGQDYAIRFRDSGGDSHLRTIATTPAGWTDNFTLDAGSPDPSIGDLVMFGLVDPGPAQLFRVRDIEWLPDLTARLTLVDDFTAVPSLAACDTDTIPAGAYAYADFVNGCYFIDGEAVTREEWILADVDNWGDFSPDTAIVDGLGWNGALGEYPVLGSAIMAAIGGANEGATMVFEGTFSSNLNLLEVSPHRLPDFDTFWDFLYGSTGASYNTIEMDGSSSLVTKTTPPKTLSSGDIKLAFSFMWADDSRVSVSRVSQAMTGLPLVGGLFSDTGVDEFNACAIGWDDPDGYIRTITIYTPMKMPKEADALVDNEATTPDATAYVDADFKQGVFKINNVTASLGDILDDSLDTGTWGTWTQADYYNAGEGLLDMEDNGVAVAVAAAPWSVVKSDFTAVLDVRAEDAAVCYSVIYNQPGSSFRSDFSYDASTSTNIELSSTPNHVDASAEARDDTQLGGTVNRIGWTSKRAIGYSAIALGQPLIYNLPADQYAIAPYSATQTKSGGTIDPATDFDEWLFTLDFGIVVERLRIYSPSLTDSQLIAATGCSAPQPLATFAYRGPGPGGTNLDLTTNTVISWYDSDYLSDSAWGDAIYLDRANEDRVMMIPGYTYARVSSGLRLTNVTAASDVTISIYKNGTLVCARREQCALTTIESFCTTPPLAASVGDYFQVYTQVSGDTAVDCARLERNISIEYMPLPSPPGTPLGPIEAFSGACLSLSTDATAVDATANYTISFDTEDYDVGGWHSGGSPTRLTVPSGVSWAKFTATAAIDSGTSAECFKLFIRKNGTEVYPGCPVDTYEGGAAARLVACTPFLSVTAGDYFEAVISVEADTSVTVAKLGTLFSGEAYASPSDTFYGFKGALVYKSADQTTANFTTETAITWDSEQYDQGGWHSTVSNTSRFTPPSVLGTGGHGCRLHACIHIDLINNNDVKIVVRLNGNPLTSMYPVSGSHHTITQTTQQIHFSSPVITASTAQFLELFLLVQTDTSVTIQGGANKSWFAVEWVPTFNVDGTRY